ncbi:hypothetical protein QJS10_CPB18g00642 [Acorus calamus]|uniref:Uncharacterized protein n=1 Tax=Acorus calamus TaxID=4465 RepID=A0AAV9CPJ5_ACOCL|nr:hypothetical protein QJS10_CPB18g00642 [Acorus calamus]
MTHKKEKKKKKKKKKKMMMMLNIRSSCRSFSARRSRRTRREGMELVLVRYQCFVSNTLNTT